MAVTNNLGTKNNNKALSIQINLSGLSFCVLDKDTTTVSHLDQIDFIETKNPESLLEALKELFENTRILQDQFNEVTVIHQNSWSTLVPNSIFNKEHSADYLKFNTKILATDLLEVDAIDTLESKCVYVPFTNINNYIFERFGSFNFLHATGLLVEKLSLLEKNNTSKNVYIHIAKHQFDLIIFGDGKLLFHNNFDFQTPEDFLYYILFTFEQLQINPELVTTKLLGEVSLDDENYKIAYKYIRHVSLFKPKFNLSFEQENLQKQRYYNVLNAIS
tara:strand:- start:728 stop:1552 length:825 start_codon:yes stop_codon:yes gene_type:complete